MITVIALLALSPLLVRLDSTSINQTANQSLEPQKALTVVLATGPKSEDWISELLKSATLEDIEKGAESHSCSVTADGDLVYIIDEAAFGIKRLKTESSTLLELSQKGVSCFQALSEDSLSPATFNYLLQQHIDTPNVKDIYEKGSLKLFLSPSQKFKLSAKGKTIDVSLQNMPSKNKQSDLVNTIPDPKIQATKHLPKSDSAMFEAGQGLPNISIMFGSKTRSIQNRTILAGRIMKMTGDAVAAATAKLQDSALTLQNTLMQQQLDGMWATGVASGSRSGDYANLSAQTQMTLEANIASNYQAYGFDCEAAALSFIRSCKVDDIQLNMSVSCLTNRNGTVVQTGVTIKLSR